ncbi:MAG: hypothetical protein EKK63_15810 [Acinetobacter sp.]|uniref:ERF family protein n=1 Tax=Acinetobacter sp. TaxID=472 RepID=UPI000F9B96A3|nr:ERF family protein [Acinetobacter sp.]RUP37034.1 MAG: hypothetical protein EKK63_15810 [Acinetobacter sp.]
MEKSESIKNISLALLKFQGEAKKIIKTANNPFFNSKYADLPSILDEITEPLQKCGLVVSQFPDGEGLTTILIHPDSGEYIQANGTMKPVKNDPQSIGSAITYQRRYALCAILGLNVDKDDDGNEASKPEPTPKKPWLNEGTEQFNEAIKYMKQQDDKNAALKAIMSKYSVSKQMQEVLKNAK